MRTSSLGPVAVLASALAACGTSRNIEGIASGASVCTVCHGGEDNQTGAPPLDAHGRSSSPAVGAHTAHVGAGVACRSCHLPVNPDDVRFPGHQNGVADVIFGGAALDPGSVATPAYDRATHSCSNVYCHAPSVAPGGALPDPQWNGSIASAGCGACHAAVPTSHSGVGSTPCSTCHASSVTGPAGSPAIVPGGGTHANGSVDVLAHDPGWTSINANGVTPHGMAALYQNTVAYPAGLAGCRTCHGSSLDNPAVAGIPACDACHQPYALPGTAATDWRTDCTFCHGDRTRAPAGSLADAAPPRDVQGNAASLRVGVHVSHVVGAALSDGVPCSSCHTVPTSVDDHVNGITSVVLRTPLGAASGTFAPRSGTTAATCASTYCHGAFTGGASGNTPSWDGAGTQSACTTCHGFSPTTGRHPSANGTPHDSTGLFGANLANCSPCHAGVATATSPSTISAAGRALHVNGVKDVGSSYIYRWDAVNKRCYGVACHGDSQTQYKTW